MAHSGFVFGGEEPGKKQSFYDEEVLPMLELKDVSVWLSQNNRPLAEHFSFALNRGDKAAIIGEEGNGKSTLLKLIYDESLVDGYVDHSGQIIKKGRAAYLPQMMEEQDLAKTVAGYFEGQDTAGRAGLLASLGLAADFLRSHRRVSTLSGGEKVKIQLARILMEEPDVLLLDEPTNDLDIETLEWMENYIRRSRAPVLFVSHDETLIENTANVIIHMEQLVRKTRCRISVTHAGYREYLAARRQSFDKQEQVARKQRADYGRQMERWRQVYDRVDHEQRVISRQDPGGGRLLKKKMKAVLSQEKRFERQAESFLDFPEEEAAILTRFSEDIRLPKGKTVLDFSLPELRIGERVLARNLRLFVSGGEHVGIVGRNGAGKSTLLAALWEELRNRRDITACYMPQDYSQKLNYDQTPVEYLAANYTKEDITRARMYMGSMKFTHEEMTGKIGRLSGGQRAKLLFLDMVLRNAGVLLLDEPTRNFSPLSSPVVRQTLRDFGGAIISISHDRKYLQEACDHVYRFTEAGLELQPE
ncbi:ATP-binding cassette domain-containing protein [Hydrogeniiclostridium mannosilyticum]|uniref:ATP-binding cassette domain-containing protein n=1 Tax=Hydrogeniiclostridium mannosilyticum TaxID=2764322 RepID=UPI002114E014|nr:ATP-binding cassette domain-containing protein [Hydrogeniiclostridium mannosilyticum]